MNGEDDLMGRNNLVTGIEVEEKKEAEREPTHEIE